MTKRTIKKLISWFFSLFFLFSVLTIPSNALDTVCFNVISTSVPVGATQVSITISVTQNCGYAGADISIISSLVIVSIKPIGISAVSNINSGSINWCNATNNYNTGDIIQVTFLLPTNSRSGDHWPVSLQINEIIDEDLKSVQTQVNSGEITVTESDVNLPILQLLARILVILEQLILVFMTIQRT